jgi:hypothetical protein
LLGGEEIQPMSRRVHQFGAAVKRLIVPALAEREFVSNKRRRVFRRTIEDDGSHLVQIIELQIGSKSRTGYFTVNLGVFCREFNHGVEERSILAPEVFPDCFAEMTKRLGFLFDPPQSFLGRLLRVKRREPVDYWWTLEENPVAMERNMIRVRDCLISRGIPWLTEMATLHRVRWAMQQLEERKREQANRRSEAK